jgi:hypothetical protein
MTSKHLPEPRLELIAYALEGSDDMPVETAPAARKWMDATWSRYAYRCLPMLLANQAGWMMLNRHGFRARWDGTDAQGGVTVLYLDKIPACPVTSVFGHGIVTCTIPYLFRTPPGYDLLVRGPANLPKDGAYALEGLVEADWSVATFTMNWKLTRPDHVVTFEAGEPICMIVPQVRRGLELFDPQIRDIAREPVLADALQTWARSRSYFDAGQRTAGRHALGPAWQKHYFIGTSPGGAQSDDHQTRLSLKTFAPDDL